MAFHEVRIDDTLSYGSSGGPGFLTLITELDSGAEERVSKRGSAKRKYDISYGVKTQQQLYDLQQFYIARRGCSIGFRFKDFRDFTTAVDGASTPDPEDVEFGTGDGTTAEFQLVKYYQDAGATRQRTITKPIEDTVRIAVNGSEVLTGWSVSSVTGKVLFDTPPTALDALTWGGEFDVPVRFGIELDQMLALRFDDFGWGSAPSISLIEVSDTLSNNGEFFMGGASIFDPMSASRSLSINDGRLIVAVPDDVGKRFLLPPVADVPSGGPVFAIFNEGTETIDIYYSDDTTLATTIAANASKVFWLDGTDWHAA